MNGNPFTISDPPITGMHPNLDEPHFRFSQSDRGSDELTDQIAKRLPEQVIADYRKQANWHPIPKRNWWLGRVIERFTDLDRAVPSEFCVALSYALGVTGHVQRMIQVYEVILMRAWSETGGSPLAWTAIAAELGVSASTVYGWKTLPEFAVKLEAARIAFQEDRPFKVGPGGLPYPGEDWLDPVGESGWHAEVRFIALEICARVEGEGTTRSASVRNAVYWMIEWHSTHGRVLQPAVLTALALTMGFDQTYWTAETRRRHQFDAMLNAARLDAELAAVGKTASIAALSRAAGGVERVQVRRWKLSRVYELMKRDVERNGTTEASALPMTPVS